LSAFKINIAATPIARSAATIIKARLCLGFTY
jgi:hypothetical protein